MAIISSPSEIEALKKSGAIAAGALLAARRAVRPGVETRLLNEIAEDHVRSQGARPSFLGFQGYPASLCVSLNEEVVHGIPSDRKLKPGDVVGLDIGVDYHGLFTDTAITVVVGKPAPAVQTLIDTTRTALDTAIQAAVIGATVGDLGAAVEQVVRPHGYGIILELCGHGVGRAVHEAPQIPNVGMAGSGSKLKLGQVIAIEPMIALGRPGVETLNDGWTVVTRDRSIAAHFEHTVRITELGPEVLTNL